MSPNVHGKGFPKQILSSSTTSTLLFLNVKSHLKSSSLLIYIATPQCPPIWGTADEAGLLFLTPSPGAHTHTSYRSPQERRLPFNPFANKMNLEGSLTEEA